MMQIDPRQILQDGATDGQALAWDAATGRFMPKTVSGGGGGGSSAWALLGTLTPTGTNSVQFTGISADYQDLLLVVDGIVFAGSTQLAMSGQFNGGGFGGSTGPLHSAPFNAARHGLVFMPKANGPVVSVYPAIGLNGNGDGAGTPIAMTGEPVLMMRGTNRLTGIRLSSYTNLNFTGGSISLYGR